MSVVYSQAVKTARMNAVVTAIGASGKLKLWNASGTLLATFTLGATAGTVSGSVLTFSDANGATPGILNTTASAAGTAAKASITTSADVDVITGLTVGQGGAGNLTLDTISFGSGQAITITNATITHA